MTYTITVCIVKTLDDGQRNCTKHVEFYSKNKFEKLVHLVGFIIKIYHDLRSLERHNTVEYCYRQNRFGYGDRSSVGFKPGRAYEMHYLGRK